MAYIQSEEHLKNIINKVIKENSDIIDEEKLITLEMYYELRSLQLLDAFSWEIRTNPLLLHENEYFAWRKEKSISSGVTYSFVDKRLTKDFLDKLNDLHDLSGIYAFYNKDDICLYLGVSITLGERIFSSFKERFKNYDKEIYLRYFVTKTRSDAHVLESVAISILKPVFNTTGKYNDELTLDIKLPEFSYKICCTGEKEEQQ